MPRTKISKNTKRNRDAAKEELKAERLREFDSVVEEIEHSSNILFNARIEDVFEKVKKIKEVLPKKMLSMLMGDLMNLNINSTTYFKDTDSINSSQVNTSSLLVPALSTLSTNSKKSRDDEGYLTEDSGSHKISGVLLPSFPTNIGRTPGPLSSAKAKGRVRRSQSASGLTGKVIQSKHPSLEHTSRSRSRTPQCQPILRLKAFSADRAAITPKISSDSPPVLCRWPKPGETIISLSGSPVVAQSAPDVMANINIPTRNGMFSLRPKKIDSFEMGQHIAERIDSDTLVQIKQLQSHLNMIMSLATTNDKKKFK